MRQHGLPQYRHRHGDRSHVRNSLPETTQSGETPSLDEALRELGTTITVTLTVVTLLQLVARAIGAF